MITRLLCLLLGHDWTDWARARNRALITFECLCHRCGKVWTI